MKYERRAILSLVAMGRITASEAERLMLASQSAAMQNAWALIVVACLILWIAPAHPHFNGLAGMVHTALAHGTRALHNAVSIGFKSTGGSV